MSARPFLKAKAGAAMNLAANANSEPQEIFQLSLISYGVVWSGSPTGVFTIQVSNDYVPGSSLNSAPVNAGSWDTLTGADTASPSGSGGHALLEAPLTGAAYMRLHYEKTSGTGSATPYPSAKVT